MKGNTKKVFVLGLDGGTFDLITPWANEGKLPNLAKLLREGASGELESTIPPVTAPAWASFFTGKNPGKHGMYDFVNFNCETHNLSYLSSEDCESEAIWSILSQKGKKICIINVPMTYPPPAVNGIFIAGMAPEFDSEFVYPRSLQREIKRKFPNYIILARPDKEPGRFLKNIKKMTRARAEVAKYLLTSGEWDVFMVVFNATDIVQHRFWGYMKSRNGVAQSRHANAILEVYRLIDEKIGELWDCLDEDTIFIVMSDHGAGPLEKRVHLNRWLEENGYLSFKTHTEDNWLWKMAKKTLIKSFLFWNNRIPSHIQDKIKTFIPGIKSLGAFERVESMMNVQFNWGNTKAYHVGTYANLRINLKGREAQGIVEPGEEYEAIREQIIKEMLELREPETGEKLVERVFKREEIHHGDALDKAPDMIIKWARDAYWSSARFGKRGTGVFESHEGQLGTLTTTGTHKANGILIAAGKTILPQGINNAKIIDLTPTILYAMGLPIPMDMDGKPLVELFTEEFKRSRKIEYEEREFVHRRKKTVLSQEDDRKMKEHLKGLGYLG